MLWNILLIIVVVMILVGIYYLRNQQQKAESPTAVAALIERLDQLGFYKYALAADIARFKAEAVARGYPFVDETLQRDFAADAEDLAEGEVESFLNDLAPHLRVLGVRIDSISQEIGDNTDYRVMINDRTYIIYTAAEIHTHNIWELAATRTLAIVNTLLIEAGSDEQVYLLSGGNDCRAILLTPAMYAEIKASQLLTGENMPQPVSVSPAE